MRALRPLSPRTGKLLVRAAFDDGDVDACQGQLAKPASVPSALPRQPRLHVPSSANSHVPAVPMRSFGVQTDLAPLHLSDPISPAQMPIFSVAGCSPYKYKLHTGWKDLRQDFRLALQSPVRCHLRISCCGAQAFQYDLTGWAPGVAGAVRGRFSRRDQSIAWRPISLRSWSFLRNRLSRWSLRRIGGMAIDCVGGPR